MNNLVRTKNEKICHLYYKVKNQNNLYTPTSFYLDYIFKNSKPIMKWGRIAALGLEQMIGMFLVSWQCR